MRPMYIVYFTILVPYKHVLRVSYVDGRFEDESKSINQSSPTRSIGRKDAHMARFCTLPYIFTYIHKGHTRYGGC